MVSLGVGVTGYLYSELCLCTFSKINSLLCTRLLKEYLGAKRKNEPIRLRCLGVPWGPSEMAEGRWGHGRAPVGCALELPLLLQPGCGPPAVQVSGGASGLRGERRSSRILALLEGFLLFCSQLSAGHRVGPQYVSFSGFVWDPLQSWHLKCHDRRRPCCFVPKRDKHVSFTLN